MDPGLKNGSWPQIQDSGLRFRTDLRFRTLASDSGSGFWNILNAIEDDKGTRSYDYPFHTLRIDWIGLDTLYRSTLHHRSVVSRLEQQVRAR